MGSASPKMQLWIAILDQKTHSSKFLKRFHVLKLNKVYHDISALLRIFWIEFESIIPELKGKWSHLGTGNWLFQF